MNLWGAIATFALVTVALSTRAAAAPPPAPASAKRALPDYRGRPAPARSAGEVCVWAPRVLLSPFYVVTEYVLREPLAVAVPAAERADVPRKVYDFFAFGPQHKAGILPVAYFDFDFNPSLGVYSFWNDALAKGNDWSLHAEAWPTDWYAVSFKEAVRLDATKRLELHFLGTHRPDRVFYGLGPESLQSSQSRYIEALTEESATLEWRYLPGGIAQVAVGLRSESLGPGAYGTDPSLEKEAATGAFKIPYGFGGRYTAEINRAFVSLDSRRHWPAPGSGARVEAQGEQGSDLLASSGWIRYGAAVSGFLDLTGHQRVLSLTVSTRFADSLGDRPVPFTELVTLGGDGPMRGYFTGRLRDRSAAAAALHYVWPIGPWLGGNIEAAVGNVFGEHLQGFQPDLLRFSGDVGITTVGVGDYPIEAVVGVGSETFAHGGQIDSVRLMVSVNHGF